jgi:hypothetical protein
MAITKTTGLQLAIASTYGSSKTMSAVSNASTGVATLQSSHGVLEGDIMEVTSGWKRLNNRIIRAGTVATNDVNLEGVSTSSTSDYPAGEGVGSIREITAWTSITGLRPDFTTSGGGFEQLDGTEVDDLRRIIIPGLAEPVVWTFPFHWPAASGWQTVVESAARGGTPVAFRISLGTKRIYGNAYWGFNNSFGNNGSIAVGSIQLSAVADETYYAS